MIIDKNFRMPYAAPIAETSAMLPCLLCESDQLIDGGLEDITVEDWTL